MSSTQILWNRQASISSRLGQSLLYVFLSRFDLRLAHSKCGVDRRRPYRDLSDKETSSPSGEWDKLPTTFVQGTTRRFAFIDVATWVTLTKAIVVPILMKEAAIILTPTITVQEVMDTPTRFGPIQDRMLIGRDLSMLAETGMNEHSL